MTLSLSNLREKKGFEILVVKRDAEKKKLLKMNTLYKIVIQRIRHCMYFLRLTIYLVC